jgi:hypothetical protein
VRSEVTCHGRHHQPGGLGAGIASTIVAGRGESTNGEIS